MKKFHHSIFIMIISVVHAFSASLRLCVELLTIPVIFSLQSSYCDKPRRHHRVVLAIRLKPD